MKYVNDDDRVAFEDADGDTLFLLRYPRQRDIERIAEVERGLALKEMELLGMNAEKLIAEASREDIEAAIKANEAENDDLLSDAYEVRQARFCALIVGIQPKGGEFRNREAAIADYENLDPASAKWVDGCVAKTWKSALPSEDDTQGAGAHAAPVAV